MKKVALTNSDKLFIIDDVDYKKVKLFTWCITGRDVVRATSGGFPLARYLKGFPKGLLVDHRDGDTLNNCRGNLRKCTKAENNRNTRKTIPLVEGRKTTSKFKGVFKQNREKYFVGIGLNGKRQHLGTFNSEIVAAKIYDKFALEYYGEFASLNIYTKNEENKWQTVKHLYMQYSVHKKKSKFYGVYYIKPNKNSRTINAKWRGTLTVNKKSINCGKYDIELECAVAVNEKIKELKLDKPLNKFTKTELKQLTKLN